MDRASRLTLLWKIALITFAVVMTALTAYSLLYWERQSTAHTAGTLGVERGARDARWHWPIVGLAPDSPLLQAGARIGDSFDYAHPADFYRMIGTDETIDLTLYRDGQARAITVRPAQLAATPASKAAWDDFLVNTVMSVCCLVLCVLVGLRGAQDAPTRILALLLATPMLSQLRFNLPGGSLHDVFSFLIVPLCICASYYAFLYFTLQFPQADPLMRRQPVRIGFIMASTALWLAYGASIVQNYTGRIWIALDPAVLNPIRADLIVVIVLCGLAAMATGWYRAAGEERQRLGWVGLSLGVIFFTYGIYNAFPFFSPGGAMINNKLLDCIQLFCYVMLSYATLRYRLFDISFAINRTLVFSVTSAALILVFFLLERFAHQFLHFESAENNALLSGAIAFALFFTFNRLHHRVDHVVEKVLFHSWHANAAALDQFVHKASHFTAAEQLLEALGNELDRFTGAAGHALYRSNADSGIFERVHASLPAMPPTIGDNDDIAVTLRSRRAPATLKEVAWPQSGELALPMLQGANLYGIAIVGAKPNGNLYRPDEIAALAFAVTQVGLDLFALRVQQLEAEHRDMHRRTAVTEDRLTAALREMESVRLALSASARA